MYWIPAIFIFIEIIYILTMDKLLVYGSAKNLADKYKDTNLKIYIENKYPNGDKVTAFFGFFLLLELIYFIVGLFFSLWMISVFIIFSYILNSLYHKIKKEQSIEKTIKLAKLEGFESSSVKFDRLLKLNEINTSEIKTNEWRMYIYPLIRIIAFTLIIVLHYNFKLI